MTVRVIATFPRLLTVSGFGRAELCLMLLQ